MHARRSLALVAAVVIVPACVTGCASSSNDQSGAAPEQPGQPPSTGSPVADIAALVGQWTLATLGGQDVGAMLPAGARVPMLDFAGNGQVAGFAGVNRLSTRLDPATLLTDQPLFGPAVTTRMAGPEPLMSLEDRFLEALEQTRAARIDAGTLLLLGPEGQTLAALARDGE